MARAEGAAARRVRPEELGAGARVGQGQPLSLAESLLRVRRARRDDRHGGETLLSSSRSATTCPARLLKGHGFDVVYKESDGAHTWTNWREYLNEFAPLLFR